MKLVIRDFQLKERHAGLPWHLKFKYFFTLKKRRFFYMFLIYMWYRYGERVRNWLKNKRIRTINKYKRRWLARFTPQAVFYQTAIEAAYVKPEKLTREQADRLGAMFIEADRRLSHGCSRQLVVNILNRVS
jgi:hypothetical protein